MRLDHQETQVDIMLMQDKIVSNRIHDDIDDGIAPPAGRITKSLQGHDPAKRRIKEIYEADNTFFE